MAIVGGLAGVVGFYLYEQAERAISKGEALWGLGWLFTDNGKSDAQAWQIGGLAIMVVGGIFLIVGLVVALARRG